MGKGKGMLERAVIRFRKNFKIFELKGYSDYRIQKFCINVNKKLNLKIMIKNNYNIVYNLWCKNNLYLNYFEKYLIY